MLCGCGAAFSARNDPGPALPTFVEDFVYEVGPVHTALLTRAWRINFWNLTARWTRSRRGVLPGQIAGLWLSLQNNPPVTNNDIG